MNQQLKLINDIITRNSPNDYVMIISDSIIHGNANMNINIKDIAKSKKIDPKKMNFIIAYLGETNKIGQQLNFNAYTDDCSKCKNCSYDIFYLIIFFLIIIIVIFI